MKYTKLTLIIKTIDTSDSVKLPGIKIYNILKFDGHISGLCRKGLIQLNPISRQGNTWVKSNSKIIIVLFIPI